MTKKIQSPTQYFSNWIWKEKKMVESFDISSLILSLYPWYIVLITNIVLASGWSKLNHMCHTQHTHTHTSTQQTHGCQQSICSLNLYTFKPTISTEKVFCLSTLRTYDVDKFLIHCPQENPNKNWKPTTNSKIKNKDIKLYIFMEYFVLFYYIFTKLFFYCSIRVCFAWTLYLSWPSCQPWII